MVVSLFNVFASAQRNNTSSGKMKGDSNLHKVTVNVNGQKLIEIMHDDEPRCLISVNGDTIVKYEDYYADIIFLDINGDGYKDIRIYIFGNAGSNQCENYFFDPVAKKFILIQGCDLDITLIKGTKLFYSYNHAGCADYDWESHLCKIEKWTEVDIGYINCHNCGDKDDGIKIYKVADQNNEYTKKLFKEMPIPKFDNNSKNNSKWNFIEKYWTKNYNYFE